MTTLREDPKPYLDTCGCIITTQWEIEPVTFFERRIKLTIVRTHCGACRVKTGSVSLTQSTSSLLDCSKCRFYFWMGWVAVAGWLGTAVLYIYVL